MNGDALKDLLQAMSNAAASGVSMPVDVIAAGLERAGLKVGEPVGGSRWMELQGLTREVSPGMQAAGDVATGLLSLGATAAAPKVARGLLALEDNLAAPAGRRAAELGAIDLGAKKRLIEDLKGLADGIEPYRLGDVTEGQARHLAELAGRKPASRDVVMDDRALRHIIENRIEKDGFTPEEVAKFAEEALRPRAKAQMATNSRHSFPSMVNESRDPVTGRLYDATMPLYPGEGAFVVKSVFPDGLRPRKTKPPQP